MPRDPQIMCCGWSPPTLQLKQQGAELCEFINQSRILATYVMASESQEYALHQEIASFFSKTSVHRETCDVVAKELVGGDQVVPVTVQGVCSYTVYAGQDLGYVVQFRLKSLQLRIETAALARQIYRSFAPDVSLKQQLGEDSTTARQGPLLVYVMARMRGISRLDFILAYGFPENSSENMARRKNLIQDVARSALDCLSMLLPI